MIRFWRFLFWAATAFTFVMAVIPAPPTLPTSDKFQHMLAFAVLAGLALCAFPRAAIWKLFVWLALFGGAIELAQATSIVGRSGDWLDWAADLAAAGCTLAIGAIFRRAWKHRLR